MENRPKNQGGIHSHIWVFAILGAALGLFFLVYVPRLKGVADSLFLFAGFHAVGALVLGATAYVAVLRDRLRRKNDSGVSSGGALEYGWGPEWMNGLGIAALLAFSSAVLLQATSPGWWPLSFMLVLLGGSFLVGNSIMRSFRRLDQAVLPMVDLLSGDHDTVLDAGCGAGRTTIAIGRVLKQGSVVALDRFDAAYIDDGGMALLRRNLKIASMTDRVTIQTGDLGSLPFPEGAFDSAVSTNVFDHLGRAKEAALSEVRRVLKPGGRFLVLVWVPGWAMFMVGNILSLFLTSKDQWRMMAQRAGFVVKEHGLFNASWYMLLEKPSAGGRS